MIWTSLLEPLDTHPATSYVGHMPSEHLTAKQAAERLGVDVRTIHRAVAAGRLAPVFKGTGLRGAYVFTVDAVDALAEGADDGDPTFGEPWLSWGGGDE